ncbi:MAG TPA: endonuclease Q family protein [Patescibacteria group bacterium]
MHVVADLHLHSKYSRAVSPQMTPPVMSYVGKQKGIDILSTGDWTHPLWLKEIKSFLTEAEEGLYKIKNPKPGEEKTRFLLSVEIANIYSQAGKGRRIHNLVLSPSFETSEKINKELVKRGYNITSDGRPIIGLSSKGLLELILEIDERALLIPCHIWTPWFGMYGTSSGFNSITESFGDLGKYIYGIETGLSSDPEMNWEIKELDTRSILSFSDAHSPAKMGREATVFNVQELSYSAIREAIMAPMLKSQGKEVSNMVAYTIEFYPEEGKYHYSGHRKCHVALTPEEQKKSSGICPVCGRKVTDGVMRRVQELANEDPRGVAKQNDAGLKWITDPKKMHPPFVKIVPLNEIIAEAIDRPVTSPKVKVLFDELCEKLESELFVLLKAEINDIAKIAGEKVAEAVQKVRSANIVIKPGYDGVYGVVKIWHEGKDVAKDTDDEKEKSQLGLGL